MEAGCVMKPAFCGPCFGAGDTPANNADVGAVAQLHGGVGLAEALVAPFGIHAAVIGVVALEEAREAGEAPAEAAEVLSKVGGDVKRTTIGSCVFANKPGDGSAREQAASPLK